MSAVIEMTDKVAEVQTKSLAPKIMSGVVTTLKEEATRSFQTSNRALLNDVRVRFDAMKRTLGELQGILDGGYDQSTGKMLTSDAKAWLNGYSRIRAIKGTVKTTVVEDC